PPIDDRRLNGPDPSAFHRRLSMDRIWAMHAETKAVATSVEVRPFRDDDWPAVHAIYADGIATGNATFETEVPSFERWAAAHPPEYRFVATRGDEVVGWVAASPVSDRCAYA